MTHQWLTGKSLPTEQWRKLYWKIRIFKMSCFWAGKASPFVSALFVQEDFCCLNFTLLCYLCVCFVCLVHYMQHYSETYCCELKEDPKRQHFFFIVSGVFYFSCVSTLTNVWIHTCNPSNRAYMKAFFLHSLCDRSQSAEDCFSAWCP